jgi:hypothetical protein
LSWAPTKPEAHSFLIDAFGFFMPQHNGNYSFSNENNTSWPAPEILALSMLSTREYSMYFRELILFIFTGKAPGGLVRHKEGGRVFVDTAHFKNPGALVHVQFHGIL